MPLETFLEAQPGVLEAVAFGAESSTYGAVPMAVVQLEVGLDPVRISLQLQRASRQSFGFRGLYAVHPNAEIPRRLGGKPCRFAVSWPIALGSVEAVGLYVGELRVQLKCRDTPPGHELPGMTQQSAAHTMVPVSLIHHEYQDPAHGLFRGVHRWQHEPHQPNNAPIHFRNESPVDGRWHGLEALFQRLRCTCVAQATHQCGQGWAVNRDHWPDQDARNASHWAVWLMNHAEVARSAASQGDWVNLIVQSLKSQSLPSAFRDESTAIMMQNVDILPVSLMDLVLLRCSSHVQ